MSWLSVLGLHSPWTVTPEAYFWRLKTSTSVAPPSPYLQASKHSKHAGQVHWDKCSDYSVARTVISFCSFVFPKKTGTSVHELEKKHTGLALLQYLHAEADGEADVVGGYPEAPLQHRVGLDEESRGRGGAGGHQELLAPVAPNAVAFQHLG